MGLAGQLGETQAQDTEYGTVKCWLRRCSGSGQRYSVMFRESSKEVTFGQAPK